MRYGKAIQEKMIKKTDICSWQMYVRCEFVDGWVFPFGTNHFSSVVVMSQGGVRTGFCDASEIAALGTKVALVPFDSRSKAGQR